MSLCRSINRTRNCQRCNNHRRQASDNPRESCRHPVVPSIFLLRLPSTSSRLLPLPFRHHSLLSPLRCLLRPRHSRCRPAPCSLLLESLFLPLRLLLLLLLLLLPLLRHRPRPVLRHPLRSSRPGCAPHTRRTWETRWKAISTTPPCPPRLSPDSATPIPGPIVEAWAEAVGPSTRMAASLRAVCSPAPAVCPTCPACPFPQHPLGVRATRCR